MTTLGDKRAPPGWGFLALWFVANLAGWLLYSIPVGMVQMSLGFNRLDEPQYAGQISTWLLVLGAVLCGAAIGMTIGMAQWLVLHRELGRMGGWVIATLGGHALIGLLPLIASIVQPGWQDWGFALIINGKMHWLARVEPNWLAASWRAGTITLTLFGAVLGVMQWLVLRKHVYQAGWWIAISIGGWALTGVLSLIPFWSIFTSWVVPIVITGIGLLWLLQRPVPASAVPRQRTSIAPPD